MRIERDGGISRMPGEKVRLTWWIGFLSRLVALVLLVVVGGCTPSRQQARTTPPPKPPEPVVPSPEEPEAAAEKDEAPAEPQHSVVRIVTSKGDIVLELFDKEAPITAGNFLLLVEDGFYDGVVFHRVDRGFVIQGGDPEGTGAGGPGFTIPDELSPELKHDRGMLSMAKSAAPDTGGSQFFICIGGAPVLRHLDMLHSVFGEVVEGMGVVDEIKPGDPMLKVRVEEESAHAQAAREAAEGARVHE